MTPEQKSAYVVAHSTMMLAEIEMMKAANREREDSEGGQLAYGEEQFFQLIQRYENVLSHNAMVRLFHE